MDLIQWIRTEHKGIRFLFEVSILNNTPVERFRERPPGAANSIAWLIWHAARTEDFVVNGMIRMRPQILQEEDWGKRLGIDDLRIGTGFGDEEVEELTKSIEVSVLDDYWKAVGADTSAWLKTITPEELDEVPDMDERLAVVPPAFTAGNAALEIWRGRTSGFVLGGAVINHGYIHVGEMNAIRGMLGVGGYW